MTAQLTDTGEMKMHFRPGNRDDFGIWHEVHVHDAYRVRQLHASGVKPKRIVDLGGHVGTFTRLANKYWPEAIIHSYEVSPPTYDLLCLNTAGIPNITAFQNCVLGWFGEEEGRELYPSNAMERHFREHRNPCAVSPKVVLARAESIDFLKIDVEQSEVNILTHLDAMDALKDIQFIHGEWHFDEAKRVVREIVGKTHDIELIDVGQWNHFWARRK